MLALLQILSRMVRVDTGAEHGIGAILACADTNAATDNILQGLAEKGVNVVRLGRPTSVSCISAAYCLRLQESGTAKVQHQAAARWNLSGVQTAVVKHSDAAVHAAGPRGARPPDTGIPGQQASIWDEGESFMNIRKFTAVTGF